MWYCHQWLKSEVGQRALSSSEPDPSFHGQLLQIAKVLRCFQFAVYLANHRETIGELSAT